MKRYVYRKDSYLKGFITILFAIKIRKQRGISQHVHGEAHLPVLHTMGCSSAMKMNDLLMHVTTWMSLRHLILSQSEDIKQHCISGAHLFKAPAQLCLANRMTLKISVPSYRAMCCHRYSRASPPCFLFHKFCCW